MCGHDKLVFARVQSIERRTEPLPLGQAPAEMLSAHILADKACQLCLCVVKLMGRDVMNRLTDTWNDTVSDVQSEEVRLGQHRSCAGRTRGPPRPRHMAFMHNHDLRSCPVLYEVVG